MPVDTPAPGMLPTPRQPLRPYRICLVCLGNICRSPMAEIVLREELARAGLAAAVVVESAGTGDWHVGERMYEPARAEVTRRGYDGSSHRARQIQAADLAIYDLVVAMDQANLANLRRMSADGQTAERVRMLRSFDPGLAGGDAYGGEVPDPYGGGPEGYALAFELVMAAVKGLVGQLEGFLDAPSPERA